MEVHYFSKEINTIHKDLEPKLHGTCYRIMRKLFLSFSVLLAVACNQNNSQDKAIKISADTTLTDSFESITVNENFAAPITDSADYFEHSRLIAAGDTSGNWPVKHDVVPVSGALLPKNRIIAYYGNLYSTRMGMLGEVPKDSMFKRLLAEVEKWNVADPKTTAIPALHYIAVTAQKNGPTYRLRMPHHQIDTIVNWAKEINAQVFIDVQVGHSNIANEVKEFEKYFKMPNVHFGMDPEFSMKDGTVPGKAIGTFDAEDINDVSDYLAKIVRENHLPPKILVVHRFTGPMVTNYRKIKLRPEVQIVMHMDGWGKPAKKIGTYKKHIQGEPVQFTGFKIFYNNDTKRSGYPRVMEPGEILALSPDPVYIQYQ